MAKSHIKIKMQKDNCTTVCTKNNTRQSTLQIQEIIFDPFFLFCTVNFFSESWSHTRKKNHFRINTNKVNWPRQNWPRINGFVTVISSQSKGLAKMAQGIVKYFYDRLSQPIGVVWFAVSLSRSIVVTRSKLVYGRLWSNFVSQVPWPSKRRWPNISSNSEKIRRATFAC